MADFHLIMLSTRSFVEHLTEDQRQKVRELDFDNDIIGRAYRYTSNVQEVELLLSDAADKLSVLSPDELATWLKGIS